MKNSTRLSTKDSAAIAVPRRWPCLSAAALSAGRQERRDTEQQDRAEHRQRDDQPEQVEHAARARVGRDDGRVGALLGHRQAGRED